MATWVELAQAHRRLENTPSACQALQKDLRIDPAFEPALVEQARLHLVLGDLAQARKLLQEGLARRPDSHRLWTLAAEAELLNG